MVIPSMILEPTAPPASISHNGCPVIAAAVISPVIPPPAASIAVPVPTPVAVAIAAGAPPTGMKCTPPPMRTPPTVIAPINNNGSIIIPPYQSHSKYGPYLSLAKTSILLLIIIIAKIITRLATIPPAAPNTTVVQKLKNTIVPKQKPVTGPPYLAQK